MDYRRGPMNRKLSDGEIIKLSVNLLDEEELLKIQKSAAALTKTMRNRRPHYKIMFGDMMAYELLYRVGRWLNEEDALD